MEHEELKELVASHALGILDPQEVETVESHLATCDECQDALADFAPVVEAMGYLVAPVAIPDGSRERFMAAVRADTDSQTAPSKPLAPVISIDERRQAQRPQPAQANQPPPSVRPASFVQRFGMYAIAAALLLMVTTAAFGAYALSLNGQVNDLKAQSAQNQTAAASQGQLAALLAAPQTQVRVLSQDQTTVRVILNPQTNQAALVPITLAQLSSDKQYALWLINDSGATLVGTTTDNTGAVQMALAGKSLSQYGSFGISIEQRGTSPTTPSNSVILAQKIA